LKRLFYKAIYLAMTTTIISSQQKPAMPLSVLVVLGTAAALNTVTASAATVQADANGPMSTTSNDECLMKFSHGLEYSEFSCVFPSLKNFYFEYVFLSNPPV
jgi:hypothetical protein